MLCGAVYHHTRHSSRRCKTQRDRLVTVLEVQQCCFGSWLCIIRVVLLWECNYFITLELGVVLGVTILFIFPFCLFVCRILSTCVRELTDRGQKCLDVYYFHHVFTVIQCTPWQKEYTLLRASTDCNCNIKSILYHSWY